MLSKDKLERLGVLTESCRGKRGVFRRVEVRGMGVEDEREECPRGKGLRMVEVRKIERRGREARDENSSTYLRDDPKQSFIPSWIHLFFGGGGWGRNRG